MAAMTLLSICDRFSCLPSAAEEEDASVLRLLAIERRAYPDKQPGPGRWG